MVENEDKIPVMMYGLYDKEEIKEINRCSCGNEVNMAFVFLDDETHEPSRGVGYCSGCLNTFTQLDMNPETIFQGLDILLNNKFED